MNDLFRTTVDLPDGPSAEEYVNRLSHLAGFRTKRTSAGDAAVATVGSMMKLALIGNLIGDFMAPLKISFRRHGEHLRATIEPHYPTPVLDISANRAAFGRATTAVLDTLGVPDTRAA